MLTSSKPLKDIFFCPEESIFYSHCIETLVFNNCVGSESIVEFGSGDGSPVIRSLLNTNFNGMVNGFELSNLASETARAKIEEYELSDKYVINNCSFFDSSKLHAQYLISNPPYLPASDNKIYQPSLHGGIDGITISKQLLSLAYENVLLMMSSYSNPEGLIDYAITQGYSISNFITSPLPFGFYSSEPKVMHRISELREKQMAFFSNNIYLLTGVLFTKHKGKADLSTELVQLMKSL